MLGQVVANELSKAGLRVTRICRPVSGDRHYEQDRVPLDLSVPGFSSELSRDYFAIVHMAQERNYRNFMEGSKNTYALATSATLELLEFGASIGIQKFIFASSGSVYENSQQGRIKEPTNLDFYSAAKIAGEYAVAGYREAFTTHSLRIFHPFGSGQNPKQLFSSLANAARNGDTIELSNGSMPLFPISSITLARVFALLVLGQFDGPCYDVGGVHEMSLTEIAKQFVNATASESKVLETVDSQIQSVTPSFHPQIEEYLKREEPRSVLERRLSLFARGEPLL